LYGLTRKEGWDTIRSPKTTWKEETMKRFKIVELLRRHRILLEKRHFALGPDVHSSSFVVREACVSMLELRQTLPVAIARTMGRLNDVVAAASPEDVALMNLTTLQLAKVAERTGLSVTAVCSRDGDRYAFGPTFARMMRGRQVTIMTFVLDGEAECLRIAEAVRRAKGDPAEIVCVLNTTGIELVDGRIPVRSVAEMKRVAFPADDCPLCKRRIPIDLEYGYGREFVEAGNMLDDRVN